MTSAQRKLLRAALVISETPSIWVWLEQNDPKSLNQLETAICEVRRELEQETLTGTIEPEDKDLVDHFALADEVEVEQEQELDRLRVVEWDRDHEDGDRADRDYDERDE